MAVARPSPVRAPRIPDDVLRHIGQYLTLAEVREATLVSRAWGAAMCADALWVEIAKRHFPQLPVLSLSPPPHYRRGERIRIKTFSKTASGGVSHSFITPPPAQPVCAGALRMLYMEKRCDLHLYHNDLVTQQEVRSHQPYILHAVLSVAWITAIVFMVEIILVSEGLTDIIDIDHAFRTLNAAFSFIVASIICNVFLSAHYEPMPLVERIRKHGQLISVTAVCTVCVLILWAIARMIQHNVSSPPAERLPWLACFGPVLAMISFWQMLAIFAARPQFMAWARRPRLPTSKQIHATITTFFPGALFFSMWSLAQFVESGGQATRYLVAASAVPLWATITVTLTFYADYLWNTRKTGDLFAAISMANLSAFPIGYMVFEPRGLLILPLLFFFVTLTMSYVRQWLKRGNRVRNLQAMGSKVARMRR